MKPKALFLFAFLFNIVSCKERSCESSFNSFVDGTDEEGFICLETLDTTPFDSLNRDYSFLINDIDNTDFLLEKAKSQEETDYCIPNLVCPLFEGDIAICMLLDMYPISDDYFDYVMYQNIQRQYSSAADFWNYIHDSENNRNEIIKKISDYVDVYKNSEILYPWTEDEILGRTFEKISNSEIEVMDFCTDDGGNNYALCQFGKKGEYVTGPIEYWKIDDSGNLCIYEDEFYKKMHIKLGKIKVDEETGILYSLRNFKRVAYIYK